MSRYSTTFTFKHQSGGNGFFAEVEIDIQFTEGERSVEICYEDQENQRWKEAAIVGVRNAWRHVPAKFTAKSCATVRVIRVGWQPAETTDMTVVFAVAKAVFLALEVQPREHPEFVQSYGAFLFPK
jgi:hypothetical protein